MMPRQIDGNMQGPPMIFCGHQLCMISQPSKREAASDMVNTSVLVVGGGPVELTLAMDLETRGISVAIVETRAAGEPPA